VVIAEKTCKRVGLDTSTRMVSDAIFVSSLETSASPPRAPIPELDPLDELVTWSRKTADADNSAFSFLAQGPIRRRRSWRRSRSALQTSRLRCAKRPVRPGCRGR